MKPTFVDGLIISGIVDKVINLELENKLAINKYKEELREKINAKIMLLGMCSDVYVEEEAKNKVIKIKQLKEILKILEE